MIEYIGIADVIKLSFYKFVTLIASRSSWFYWIGIDFLYWNSILGAKFEKHEDANKFAAIEVGLDNEIYWVWKWKKISKTCHLAIFKIRFADSLPINPSFIKWALSCVSWKIIYFLGWGVLGSGVIYWRGPPSARAWWKQQLLRRREVARRKAVRSAGRLGRSLPSVSLAGNADSQNRLRVLGLTQSYGLLAWHIQISG